MGKRVRFDRDARQSLWRGIDQLASAVRITLGPRGRSVVIDRASGHAPAITRDGIAVASEVELPDPFENMGVHMLREAALRTGVEAGDGTSTATVIAHRLIGDGFAAIEAGGNPVAIRRGVETAVAAALASLAQQARPVGDARDLERVATLASGDARLGALIAQAVEAAGRDGVVAVEEGPGLDVTLEVVDGLRVPSGYASPYFVTDADDMEVALEQPLVFLCDGVLVRPAEVVPALQIAARQQRPLLVLCEDLTPKALAVLVVNRLRGTAPGVAVRMPGSDVERRAWFEDVAAVTGATLCGHGTGLAPTEVRAEHLGRAARMTASSTLTTILRGGARTETLRAWRNACASARDAASEAHEREHWDARVARIGGVVAVIRVGAATDVEREALRAQVEDALGATRAALEEGLVSGGGTALLRAAAAVEGLSLRALETPGRDSVLAALAEPARWIAHNAGLEGAAVIERLRTAEPGQGFDVQRGAWVTLADAGIVDPAKVVRCALLNAGSIAATVLTSDALVVDDAKGGEAA
jgi:chaperonin GroEL